MPKKLKGIEGAIKFGKELGINEEDSGKAWYFAMEKYQAAKEKAHNGKWLDQLNQLDAALKHTRKKTVIKQKIPEALRENSRSMCSF